MKDSKESFGERVDFKDYCKAAFGKYRTERIKRECPVCSDLWHGFYEGMNHQQKKIDELEADKRVLIEACGGVANDLADVEGNTQADESIKYDCENNYYKQSKKLKEKGVSDNVEVNFYALATQSQQTFLGNIQYDKKYKTYTRAVKTFLPVEEYTRLKLKVSPELKRLGEILAIQQDLEQKLEKARECVEFYKNRFNMNKIANGTSDDYTDDCPNKHYGISGGKRARQTYKEIWGEK